MAGTIPQPARQGYRWPMAADTTAGQAPGAAEDNETEGCRLCEVVPAVLGLLAAGVIIFVAGDLLARGRWTLALFGLLGKGRPDEHTQPAN